MKEYMLFFTEHNSFIDENAVRSTKEDDGWYENEYKIPFKAKTLKEAKEIARYKCDSSSGVFDVCDKNNKLIFTEENL